MVASAIFGIRVARCVYRADTGSITLAHISPSASVRALIAFVRSRRCETHSPVAGQIGRGVKANRGGDPANHGEMISERTKAALQAAKKRGQRLGNPGIAEAAKLGRAALKANARRFAANVRPIIDGSFGPVRPATTPLPRSSTSAMSARLAVAYGRMYRLEQSCTLSAAQAAPTHDGYKGSAVNLSIGRLCYVR
jgi:hypothetical protein